VVERKNKEWKMGRRERSGISAAPADTVLDGVDAVMVSLTVRT